MTGTIRTYDDKVRAQVAQDVQLGATKIAESQGATAEVSVVPGYPTTINDVALTASMVPVLQRATDGWVGTAPLAGASEDFSYYAAQPRAVRVPRHDAVGPGPRNCGAEPQSKILHRRRRFGRRNAGAGLDGGQLLVRNRVTS